MAAFKRRGVVGTKSDSAGGDLRAAGKKVESRRDETRPAVVTRPDDDQQVEGADVLGSLVSSHKPSVPPFP